jgi:hypothetical protein
MIDLQTFFQQDNTLPNSSQFYRFSHPTFAFEMAMFMACHVIDNQLSGRGTPRTL